MSGISDDIVESLDWPPEWPKSAKVELSTWIRSSIPTEYGHKWRKNLKAIVDSIHKNMESTKKADETNGSNESDGSVTES